MKYHSPIRIILISFMVFFIFAFIALSSVVFFDMPSPSSLFVEKMLAGLSEADKRYSVSFSSMDRRLLSSVSVNGLVFEKDGEELVHISTLKVEKGLLSIIADIVRGDSSFNIEITGVEAHAGIDAIKEIADDFSRPEAALPLKEEDGEKKDYRLNIHVYDFNAALKGIADFENVEFFISFSTMNGLNRLEARMPDFSIEYEGAYASIANLNAEISAEDSSYLARFSVSDLSMKKDDYSLHVSDLAFLAPLTGISLEDVKNTAFSLSFMQLEAGWGDEFFTRLYPAYFESDGKNLSLSLSMLISSYSEYALSLSELSASYNIADNELGLEFVSGLLFLRTQQIASFAGVSAASCLEDGTFTLHGNSISSSKIGIYTKDIYKKVDISDFDLSGRVKDGFDISMESNVGHDIRLIFESRRKS